MNNNQKGFTLIELLAAFVVIALIITVTGANINKEIKKNQIAKTEEAKNELRISAETYLVNGKVVPDASKPLEEKNVKELVDKDGTYCIKTSVMVATHYLKSNIKNNSGINGIKVTKNATTGYKYQLCTNDICTECES